MSLEIKVGPPQLAIHEGHGVLLCEPDGQIHWPGDKGLYFFDTRVLSSWTVYANGSAWDLLNGGAMNARVMRVHLVNQEFTTESGTPPPRTLGLVLTRHIDGGVHEDLDLFNYSMQPVRFNLEIALRSDFADIFEVKSGQLIRRGRIVSRWAADEQCLTNTYGNRGFVRALAVSARHGDSAAVYANGRISFDVSLGPGASWHSCLAYDLWDGERCYRAPPDCCEPGGAPSGRSGLRERPGAPPLPTLQLDSSNDLLRRLFRQAADDMAALRLRVPDMGHAGHVLAAGLPWFVALFGRDCLVASMQAALVNIEFLRGTLDVLGQLQARERDDYRDAEPGKIMHELRLGELAALKLIPHTPYYGSADATPLYLIALHTAWCCTGDRELLLRHMPTAERCLRWIDEYGDRDGDGLQEYATRSTAGLANQGWKDSGDALVHADGSLVMGPIALCELQGYVYDAWLRMACLYEVLGERGRAQALRVRAQALYAQFNTMFWDEAAGFYVFALDGAKRPVRSIVSNPGHCLWSGIVPDERAPRIVRRLLQPDMWSGWGIRTLSARHPAYNPYSYQNGAVWPHDNALIAAGFRRYGFDAEAARIVDAVCAAGGFFALNQLPELYAGLTRGTDTFPVQYLGANVPQAWAAGSVFSMLDTLLGLQPDAPAGRLYLDPALPAWLPDLTLRNLRVGAQCFDLRCWRDREQTRFEVLAGPAQCVQRRALPVWRQWLAGPDARADAEAAGARPAGAAHASNL